MQIPDVDVIRVQFAQTLLQMLLHCRLVRRVRLGREHHLLPLGAQRRAHHPLVVAVRVAARGIEIIDPGIGGALNYAAIRSDHAAESHGSYLQPGLAQHLIVQLHGSGRSFGRGHLGRLPEADLRTGARNRHHQPSR